MERRNQKAQVRVIGNRIFINSPFCSLGNSFVMFERESLVLLVCSLFLGLHGANLGEQCQNNGDCVPAFAFCNQNRCQCRENFLERQNRCIPQKYHCRFGYALLSTNGDAVQCDITSPVPYNFPFSDGLGAKVRRVALSFTCHGYPSQPYLQAPNQVWEKHHNNGSRNQNQTGSHRQIFQPFATNTGGSFQTEFNLWNPFGASGGNQQPSNNQHSNQQPSSGQYPTYPQGQGQGPYPGQYSGQYPQMPGGGQQTSQQQQQGGAGGGGGGGQYPYPNQPYPSYPQYPNPSYPSIQPSPPWTPTEPINQMCHQQIDTCPKDYYCVTYFNNALTYAAGGRAIRFSGFCCPKPQPACPVGDPLVRSDSQCNNCPTDSYFCYTDRKYGTKACCPKACSDGLTFYPDDGQCRAAARLGDQCDRDDQCGYASSRCVNVNGRKRCGCAFGYVAIGQVCAVAQCTTIPQQPLVDMYGELVRCGALMGDFGRCPLGYTCDSKVGLCCAQETSGYGQQGGSRPWMVTPNGSGNQGSAVCPNLASPLVDDFGSPTRCTANGSPACPNGYFCNGQSGTCCPLVNATTAQCPQGSVTVGQTCSPASSYQTCPAGSTCTHGGNGHYVCCRSQQSVAQAQLCPTRYFAVGGGRATCSRSSEECRQYGYTTICFNGICCGNFNKDPTDGRRKL